MIDSWCVLGTREIDVSDFMVAVDAVKNYVNNANLFEVYWRQGCVCRVLRLSSAAFVG